MQRLWLHFCFGAGFSACLSVTTFWFHDCSWNCRAGETILMVCAFGHLLFFQQTWAFSCVGSLKLDVSYLRSHRLLLRLQQISKGVLHTPVAQRHICEVRRVAEAD